MTTPRAAMLVLLLAMASAASACGPAAASAAGVLSDSTYVAAMAELQRIHDARIRAPSPPIPMPTGPNGAAATPEAQRRRDSVVRRRADAVVVDDSAKRMAVMTRYKVTVAELEETARVRAGDPAHLQRIHDAIFRRVAALDNADNVERARKAKADSGSGARKP